MLSHLSVQAYTEHFTEWRHAQGMRQLGIPNTKHFMNITNIADAQALWQKLQSVKVREQREELVLVRPPFLFAD